MGRHAPGTVPEPACLNGAALARIEYGPALKALCPITSDLRQEPGAGKPHAGICAGGR